MSVCLLIARDEGKIRVEELEAELQDVQDKLQVGCKSDVQYMMG